MLDFLSLASGKEIICLWDAPGGTKWQVFTSHVPRVAMPSQHFIPLQITQVRQKGGQ